MSLELYPTEVDGLLKCTKANGSTYTVRKNRNRIFTPDEWFKFINQKKLKDDKKEIFIFLINTGARINESINVRKRNINFDVGTVTLEVVKKRNKYSDGRIRTIPISSEYLIHLKKYTSKLEDNDFIFKTCKVAISYLFRRYLKKSGIEDWYMFSLHNIRKTLETWLASLNVNELVILKHFGHDKFTCLTHYVQIDTFNIEDKSKMRTIIGDLYSTQYGKFIENRFLDIEKKISKLNKSKKASLIVEKTTDINTSP